MTFINIKNYLNIDKSKHKFILPLSFREKIKFFIINKFVFFLPFKNLIYIDSANDLNYYWNIILNYLNKNLKISITTSNLSFEGRFLGHNVRIKDLEAINQYVAGSGFDINDKDVALSKAIGEFLERKYLHKGAVSLKKIKLSDLKKQKFFYTYSDFHSFSEKQKLNFPKLNIKEFSEFKCLKIDNLLKETKVYYPIQQISWGEGHELQIKEEEIISQVTTNGCAGGFSLEMATLSAMHENIERDSFLCYWKTFTSPNKIVIKSGSVKSYDMLLDFCENSNYDLFILDTTTDIKVPSCICVVKDKNMSTGSKGFVISGSARNSYVEAIESACLEMFMCLGHFNSNHKLSIAENKDFNLNKNIDRNTRIGMWAYNNENSHFAEFLFKGREVNLDSLQRFDLSSRDVNTDTSRVNSYKESLATLLNHFKKMENDYSHIYRHEQKNVLLKKIGFYVVRVIMPRLIPLHLNETYSFSQSDRIRDFLSSKELEPDFIENTYPHPFP